jgi:hypothetical protein
MIDLLSEAAAALVMEHQAGHHVRIPTEVLLIGFFRLWGPKNQEGYEDMWKDIQKSLPRTCAKVEEWVGAK